MGIRYMLKLADRVVMLEDGSEVVVGRAADVGICLDDLLVSRRHAVFRCKADGAYIEDCQSRNGILINGAAATGETKLKHGDRVSIGAAVIQLLDANREKHRTLPQMSTGRTDQTVPTPRASPYATATTQNARDVFGMLFDVAEKALAAKRTTDAENAVEYLANGLNE